MLKDLIKYIKKRNNKICKIFACNFCVTFKVDGITWNNDIEDKELILYHKNHYENLGYKIEYKSTVS